MEEEEYSYCIVKLIKMHIDLLNNTICTICSGQIGQDAH